jgi:hypothetical protein
MTPPRPTFLDFPQINPMHWPRDAPVKRATTRSNRGLGRGKELRRHQDTPSRSVRARLWPWGGAAGPVARGSVSGRSCLPDPYLSTNHCIGCMDAGLSGKCGSLVREGGCGNQPLGLDRGLGDTNCRVIVVAAAATVRDGRTSPSECVTPVGKYLHGTGGLSTFVSAGGGFEHV